MRVHVIARALSANRQIIGYKILCPENRQVMTTTLDSMAKALNNPSIEVIGIQKKDGKSTQLTGKNGSLSRYPGIMGKNVVENENALIIIEKLGDYGFVVCRHDGELIAVPAADVAEYGDRFGIANGKVIDRDGKKYVSSIEGTYTVSNPKLPVSLKRFNGEIVTIEDKKAIDKKSINLKDKDVKLVGPYKDMIKNIKEAQVSSKDMKDAFSGMSVDIKLAKAYGMIKHLRPFLYCLLTNMERKEVDAKTCKTMCVSLTKFMYNPSFVAGLEIEEVVFIMLHEAMHIACKHVSRCMAYKRNSKVYNIATDIYINRTLAVDLGMGHKGKTAYFEPDTYKFGKFGIKFPESALDDESIDFTKTTVDELYRKLLEKKQEQQKQKENQDGDGQGDSSGGSGGSGGSSDESNDASDDSSGSSGANNEEGEGSNESGGQQGSGEGDDEEGDGDLVLTPDELNKSLEEIKEEAIRRVVSAQTSTDLMCKQYGMGTSNIEKKIMAENAPKVDWKQIFRARMTKISKKNTSITTPMRRLLSSGVMMPGPKRADPSEIEHVVVAIDTSGSMGPKELGEVMSHIYNVLKQVDMEATLICWDGEVSSESKFQKYNDIKMNKIVGGGGTDPNCVFKYLENNKKFKSVQKRKINLMMFTDGYFGAVRSEYAKYSGTIWVITEEGYNSFKEPFGKKAVYEKHD